MSKTKTRIIEKYALSHAADPARSERLRRVLNVLRGGTWAGTWEISRDALVCAVNSIIHELRANGLDIECRCKGRGRYEYRLIK